MVFKKMDLGPKPSGFHNGHACYRCDCPGAISALPGGCVHTERLVGGRILTFVICRDCGREVLV